LLCAIKKRKGIMKHHLKEFSITLCVLLLVGCAGNLNLRTQDFHPPPLKPFIDQAVWSKLTKDKVYAECLTALHMQGFSLHPMGTSKESGLIIVRQVEIPTHTGGYVKSSYSLQLLVYELSDGKIMVSVNPKGIYRTRNLPPELVNNDSYERLFKNGINNKVAADMKHLFAQLETLLGTTESQRGGIFLKWE
jgi:hypothetical protein